MSDTRGPRTWKRSLMAVLAGLLAVVALSIGTDLLMFATGIFPPVGEPMPDSRLLLATVYRTAIGIAGSYLAARLAPDQPMRHALALGVVGLAVSLLGAVTTWGKESTIGHEWYPLTLVALALPSAWLGGEIWLLQSGRMVVQR